MLSMKINKSSMIQLEMAAIYYSVLPVRVEHAQVQAMQKAKKDLKSAVKNVGKAARYLQFELTPNGPVGVSLKIKPYPKSATRADGGNIQIASAILLTGKKGGGYINAEPGHAMKMRKASVADGYSEFYTVVRKVAIPSKRKQIQEIAKKVVLANLRREFVKQGFTARGAGGVDVVR